MSAGEYVRKREGVADKPICVHVGGNANDLAGSPAALYTIDDRSRKCRIIHVHTDKYADAALRELVDWALFVISRTNRPTVTTNLEVVDAIGPVVIKDCASVVVFRDR